MISAKSLLRSILGLIVLCLVHAPSLDAQGPSYLLTRSDVQKELALSEQQKQQIRDIRKEYLEKRVETRRDTRKWYGDFEEQAKLTAEQIYDIQQKVEHELKQVRDAANEKITALLNEQQTKRLHQLTLQRLGVASLRLQAVREQLGFSMQQQEQINKADREAGVAVLNAQMNAQKQVMTRRLQQEMINIAKQVRERQEKAYSNVLTAEQKTQFAEMQGEKFEFTHRASPRAGSGFDLGGTRIGPRKKSDGSRVEVTGTLIIEEGEKDEAAAFFIDDGKARWELDFTGGGRARADDVTRARNMARLSAGTKVTVKGKVTEWTVDGKTKKLLIMESMNSARGRR